VKKALTFILILAFSATCVLKIQAQGRKVIYLQQYEEAPYHWGFQLGLNFMDYSLNLKEDYQNQKYMKQDNLLPQPSLANGMDPYSESEYSYHQIRNVETRRITKNPGFSIGFVGDLRLGRYFNFRFIPTLSLNSRQVYYDVDMYDINGHILTVNGNDTVTQRVTSRDDLATYLEFPVHIKYRSKRYNNIGAYLFAGVNPKLYLVSRQNETEENGSSPQGGNVTNSQQEDKSNPQFLIPKRFDFALEFGVGFDIYNQWFKVGMEIKMGFGMLDILKVSKETENFLYQAPIESLKSKQLQVSFTIE